VAFSKITKAGTQVSNKRETYIILVKKTDTKAEYMSLVLNDRIFTIRIKVLPTGVGNIYHLVENFRGKKGSRTDSGGILRPLEGGRFFGRKSTGGKPTLVILLFGNKLGGMKTTGGEKI